jgi:hypothetical protein
MAGFRQKRGDVPDILTFLTYINIAFLLLGNVNYLSPSLPLTSFEVIIEMEIKFALFLGD